MAIEPTSFVRAVILSCCLSFVLSRPWGLSLSIRGGASARSMNVTMDASRSANIATSVVDVVFSDLDGTLIHYPDNPAAFAKRNSERGILLLPPSSTGMVGVISHDTLSLCRDIRLQGVKLVLVSGMRATTLLKRIPYLPKADAYCCEAGGRIFYPVTERLQGSRLVQSLAYGDAVKSEAEQFYLVEDMVWRNEMERTDAAGVDGYRGRKLHDDETGAEVVPLESRDGALWRHARSLIAQGFVIDSQGYSTCFRVNRKQQTNDVDFDSLLIGTIPRPAGLSTSSNLGCVDFYPATSGKKNCCDYLAKRFSSRGDKDPLHQRCLCLCDDDNDIEMALACLHAYVPQVTSDSMLKTIQANPKTFTLTKSESDDDDTKSTEMALLRVLDRIRNTPEA